MRSTRLYTQTQNYLAQSCGAGRVDACIERAQAGHDTHADRDHDDRANRDSQDFHLDPDDTYRMTYGFALAASMHLPESVPVQAQVIVDASPMSRLAGSCKG
jgi:hypothetical protein